MVPFDVVTGGNRMLSNSGGVTNLSESFEVLSLSIMQSSFSFADVKSITIPATGFVDNLRFLRPVETIFIRKERLNSAGVLKNNPEVDETIKLLTRQRPSEKWTHTFPVQCVKRGFARQPCCMAATMKIFCIRKNIFPQEKESIVPAMQNLYWSQNLLKLNMCNAGFNFKHKKLAAVVSVLQNMYKLAISRYCCAEDGKEMYKNL